MAPVLTFSPLKNGITIHHHLLKPRYEKTFTPFIPVGNDTYSRKWFTPADEKIVGDWLLKDVSRSRFLGWDEISSPYAGGNFHFFENGQAEFTNATDTLKGNWTMRRVRDGYYDEDGDWNDQSHLVMDLFLADFSTNNILNVYFDDFNFRSYNRVVAISQGAGHRTRYRFERR